MKKRYLLLAILVWLVWKCFSYKVEEKCILPDHYRGFFGVLYQATNRLSQLEQGERVYHIPANGVLESTDRFAIGPPKQEFYFQDESRINDTGFTPLGRLDLKVNEEDYQQIKANPQKLFAVYFFGAKINQRHNEHKSFVVYIIASGKEILTLEKKSEKIFTYMNNSFDWNWQQNKESLTKKY
ncbi:hypothetical protein [Runella sp.]|uniref:hypothetical protein n=1 Tax=Runella sp. TaxID=1960881 RepID=UPI003D0CB41B